MPARRLRSIRAAWLALLCVTGIALIASNAVADALDPRTVESTTLANGFRLVVCEDQAAPVVSIEIIVRAGSADESPEESGIAHLLEHVCWMGDQQSDPRTAIEDCGGSTNAGTLRDFTRYYATVPPADFARAVRAVADMVLKSKYDEGVVSRERAVVQEEAAGRSERPRAALNDLAFESLFGASHPYGRHIEGSEQSLADITSARLALFHRTWYVPNNMAVIIGGKIAFSTAAKAVESIFGGLSPEALPERAPAVARPAEGRERVVETSLQDVYLMAAFLFPGISDPASVCASDIIATILTHPQVGRLVKELQDRRGLVKGVGVDFLTQRRQGLFGVWAICDAENVDAVKQAISTELARLAAEPIAPAELTTAKRLLGAEYTFSNETAAERASTLGFYEAIDSYRTASLYPSLVRSVTAADVARVATLYAKEPVWIAMKPGTQR